MGNQYWKSSNQISKGVSQDRIEEYKKNVVERKPLMWKLIAIPSVITLFLFTMLASGVSKVLSSVMDGIFY